MASTAKEKFDAAIKVIHSLPKDGPFQPSNEMMLTFYGYFKQATEGPCTAPKPSFWEVVKKAKWEAWHKLGTMPRETAMELYVEELKKTLRVCTDKWNEMDQNNDPRIVEAMPQTNVVGNFMETLGSFYEIVEEEPPMKGVVVPSKKAIDAFKDSDLGSQQEKQSGELTPSNMSQLVESALKTFGHTEEDPETSLSQSDGHLEALAPNKAYTRLTNGPVSTVHENVVNGKGDSSESFGNQSFSESEDEFCDTSDNPIETLEVLKPNVNGEAEVQMSTPVKTMPFSSQRVRFADPPSSSITNGRISPIVQLEDQLVSLPAEFPYMSKSAGRELSDSVLANAGDSPIHTLSYSQLTQGEASVMDFSANNSSFLSIPVGGRQAEGGEEPEENRQGSGRSNKQSQGGSTGRSGSGSGMLSGSSGGRRSLLSGNGATGGGGEDNPPQHQQSHAPNDELSMILIRLQQDMTTVLDRLNRLEAQVQHRRREESSVTNRFFSWWPLSSRAGRTAFFILVWPVIVHLVLSYLFRRRRRNP